VQQGLQLVSADLFCNGIIKAISSAQPDKSSLKRLNAVAISPLGCIKLSLDALPLLTFVKLAMITFTSYY